MKLGFNVNGIEVPAELDVLRNDKPSQVMNNLAISTYGKMNSSLIFFFKLSCLVLKEFEVSISSLP